ncbi:MAG TPA: hypothetical protein PKY59_13045 [Pyrinomonadaceae bacterium]|nr:hypothetical protein [Pyrinomonadaceae bacterium]
MNENITEQFNYQLLNSTTNPAFEPAPERTVSDKNRPFPIHEIWNMNLENKGERKNVIRTRNQAFCAFCELQVGLVAIEKAAENYQTTSVEIVVLAEKGIVHRLHNAKGKVMLCANSLFDAETHLQQTRSMSFENSLKIKLA